MYITEKRLLKWSLYGNIIYIFLYFIFRPQGINASKIAITSLLLFSIISLVFISFNNRRKLKEIPKFGRVVFNLLLFYSCIVIIRSFSLSIQDWVTNFGNVNMGLSWLVPIVLILGQKIENWNLVIKTIIFMFQLMIFLFFISLFYNDNYIDWVWLLRPVSLILLIGLFHFRFFDKTKVYIIIIIYLITVTIYSSRRIDLLFLAMTIGFVIMDRLFSFSIKKRFLKYIFGGFILAFTLIFTVGYEFISNMISSVIEFQDSRTFVFNELFQGLRSTKDELFGRGSLGTYYSLFFEKTRSYYVLHPEDAWIGDVPDRITIEVGYLQMLLKGGFILLILNMAIFIYAIYLALFKSNNKFIKRLGYYILIITILSLVEFTPSFTPVFIIFWMAIGTVLNRNYRAMGNKEIQKLIKFK